MSMDKLKKILNREENNHIFPLLWMHGESEKTIRTYVQKIYESGIRALCVEPRPHPEFAGEMWWRDLEIVIDECQKKDMKVWLFDDAQFPTGYANGAIVTKHPELRKKYLKITQIDYFGPQKEAGIIVKWHVGTHRHDMVVGEDGNNLSATIPDKMLGVVAAKVIDYTTIDTESLVEITSYVSDGVVYWDIPEGTWRIFTLVETFDGGEEETEGYLNPIDPEATQVLIDAIYEPHATYVGEHFGKTIVGFFTDEPRFGNIGDYHASIGRTEMVLPWRSDLMSILESELGENPITKLPLLLVDGNADQSRIRYVYMNVISRLYSENFCERLGQWCKEHDLEYVGHLIEDNNAHARLGYGAGHFFRAIKGQTMSGIDVVLHQLLPGLDKGYFKSITPTGYDGEFFHYGLAKLGSSLGHLDPTKNGRTMVEIYGAYGWSEGLNLMKWMTDHMLVRGVNQFVPHAFDMASFPDPDCPPHFYAHGNNPQYRYLSLLMNYTNRAAELLSDGVHIANALILYHAEAEWSGEYMLFQKPAKVLTQNQIDFDIISIDFLENIVVKNNKLCIHKEEFDVFVIPYAEKLPRIFFKHMEKLVKQGANILFVDGYPEGASEGNSIKNEQKLYQAADNVNIITLDELPIFLRERKYYDILPSTNVKELRYCHYARKEESVYMFFNESPNQWIKSDVSLKETGYIYQYDAFENTVERIGKEEKGSIPLNLAPQEAVFYVVSKLEEDYPQKNVQKRILETELLGTWKVSLATSEEYPKFGQTFMMQELENIASPKYHPDFSGTIAYEKYFEIEMGDVNTIYLDLGDVYEVVEVTVNNQHVGIKISQPYVFDITEQVKEGENLLRIEVTNTLGTQQKDFLSQYRALQPSGLLGKVKVLKS